MQLTCLAEASKGAYFSAETAGELQQALLKVPEQIELDASSADGSLIVTASGNDAYTVFDPTNGERIESARTNTAIEILPGYYSIKIGSHWIRDIELSDGQQLELAEPVD